ncbi:MAG: hypothetical protein R3327_07090 [Nitrosopumilaceae archaeon]|nr:hypothetical protein [Nitrosopumilaceae archaeon]
MSRTKNKTHSTLTKLEPIIVGAVILTVLLPVRLLFTTYLSDDWFSSFGMVAAISLLLLVLVKKNKLGRFGEMFRNQMLKIQYGKKGIIVYGYVIFIIFFLSLMILAVNQGNSEYSFLKEQIMSEDFMKSSQSNESLNVDNWIGGIFNFFYLLVSGSPKMFALMAILNDIFDGWLLHFYTVGLVESLELLGILIVYRVFIPKKLETTDP